MHIRTTKTILQKCAIIDLIYVLKIKQRRK